MWEGFGSADSWYKQGIDMSFQENGVTAPVDDYMNSNLAPRAYVFPIISMGKHFLLRVRLLSSLKEQQSRSWKNYDSEMDCFVS